MSDDEGRKKASKLCWEKRGKGGEQASGSASVVGPSRKPSSYYLKWSVLKVSTAQGILSFDHDTSILDLVVLPTAASCQKHHSLYSVNPLQLYSASQRQGKDFIRVAGKPRETEAGNLRLEIHGYSLASLKAHSGRPGLAEILVIHLRTEHR